jgi:hypothetical protein
MKWQKFATMGFMVDYTITLTAENCDGSDEAQNSISISSPKYFGLSICQSSSVLHRRGKRPNSIYTLSAAYPEVTCLAIPEGHRRQAAITP